MWLVARRRTRCGIEGDGDVFYFLKWKKFPWWFLEKHKTRTICTEKSSGFFGFFVLPQKRGQRKKWKSNSKFFIIDENSQGFPPFSLISSCRRRRTCIFFFGWVSFFSRVKKLKKPTSQSDVKLKPHIYTYSRQFQSIFFRQDKHDDKRWPSRKRQ